MMMMMSICCSYISLLFQLGCVTLRAIFFHVFPEYLKSARVWAARKYLKYEWKWLCTRYEWDMYGWLENYFTMEIENVSSGTLRVWGSMLWFGRGVILKRIWESLLPIRRSQVKVGRMSGWWTDLMGRSGCHNSHNANWWSLLLPH